MELSPNMIIKVQTNIQRIKLMKIKQIMQCMALVLRTCLSTKKLGSKLSMSRIVC